MIFPIKKIKQQGFQSTFPLYVGTSQPFSLSRTQTLHHQNESHWSQFRERRFLISHRSAPDGPEKRSSASLLERKTNWAVFQRYEKVLRSSRRPFQPFMSLTSFLLRESDATISVVGHADGRCYPPQGVNRKGNRQANHPKRRTVLKIGTDRHWNI
jgi:hypothetical protein